MLPIARSIRATILDPVLSEEEIAELEAAEKLQIQYDSDCPEMTATMLEQFHRMNSVSIALSPADVQKVALSDSDMVKKCI